MLTPLILRGIVDAPRWGFSLPQTSRPLTSAILHFMDLRPTALIPRSGIHNEYIDTQSIHPFGHQHARMFSTEPNPRARPPKWKFHARSAPRAPELPNAPVLIRMCTTGAILGARPPKWRFQARSGPRAPELPNAPVSIRMCTTGASLGARPRQ